MDVNSLSENIQNDLIACLSGFIGDDLPAETLQALTDSCCEIVVRNITSTKFDIHLTNGLDLETRTRLDQWVATEDKNAIAMQKKHIRKTDPFYKVYLSAWEMGYPYTGACGGVLSYNKTPTSLGCVIKVTHEITGNTIDLTDNDAW